MSKRDTPKSLLRLDGKVALITGGSKGLGEAMAQVLAQHGASIVITDVDEKPGRKVAKQIVADGGQALFLRHDVTDESQWIKVLAKAQKHFGAVHVLVNNAGLGVAASAEDATLEHWRQLMAVNLDGVFLGTKHGIRAMKHTGGGSIVNISSMEGIIADPNFAAYNASKGGVRIFTKSAALHCAKSGYNIRVNSVHPGFIWTPMVENYLSTTGGDVAAGREQIGKAHPLGHMGEPLDVAYGVLYLASEASKFVTGSELVIDGGYTAQ